MVARPHIIHEFPVHDNMKFTDLTHPGITEINREVRRHREISVVGSISPLVAKIAPMIDRIIQDINNLQDVPDIRIDFSSKNHPQAIVDYPVLLPYTSRPLLASYVIAQLIEEFSL